MKANATTIDSMSRDGYAGNRAARERMRGMPLSPREIETVRELSLGKSNKEISSALFISEDTVKHHLKNIQAKLGASNRVAVVLAALRMELIEMPDTVG